MLKIKLFKGFVALVVLFGVLSAFVSVSTIQKRVMEEAQTRVRLDLSSAWSVYNSRMEAIEIVLRSAASKQLILNALQNDTWDTPDVRARLERIRVREGLDFLDLVGIDGRVLVRTTPPYATGDLLVSQPTVASALKGNTMTAMSLLSQSEMEKESDGLAEKAFLELDDTPRARRVHKEVETRGMVMVGAVPVQHGAQVVGAVYGGVLVNRNHGLIDSIHNVVYRNEQYKGVAKGTATIFLHDSRIATTVRLENGNRALGTRVSKKVADRVLDNGKPWIGEAFVVRDWYLTAYDPIRNGVGEVIGMLYVGILKQPFVDDARTMVVTYLFLSLFVLLVALALAFLIAGRLAFPIHRLVEAANAMRHGDPPTPVPTDKACHETAALIVAFNQMTQALAEREERLKALNRSYMETLGFVSHELKSPVATIMNYVFLMREQKIGPLNEKQQKAVNAIDKGSQRLVEMVRHYLNLSRIENQEMRPVRTRVKVLEDVLQPLFDSMDSHLEERRMCLDNRVSEDIELDADMNMVREVFENLVGNAIKYGREGGDILMKAEPGDGVVTFSVRNEGEGIPEDKLGSLFQKFSRLEGEAAARKQKGTGLGLFITKHIVEAHGGRIEAASEYGKWAEFTFTLPQADANGKKTDD